MSLLVLSGIQILVVVLELNCTVSSDCQNINTFLLNYSILASQLLFMYITLGLVGPVAQSV
jgi:hypothetical protein